MLFPRELFYMYFIIVNFFLNMQKILGVRKKKWSLEFRITDSAFKIGYKIYILNIKINTKQVGLLPYGAGRTDDILSLQMESQIKDGQIYTGKFNLTALTVTHNEQSRQTLEHPHTPTNVWTAAVCMHTCSAPGRANDSQALLLLPISCFDTRLGGIKTFFRCFSLFRKSRGGGGWCEIRITQLTPPGPHSRWSTISYQIQNFEKL